MIKSSLSKAIRADIDFKLDLAEPVNNSANSDIEEETSFIEGEDIFTLPCVQPRSSEWGARIFGLQEDSHSGKNRSDSTAVNRVEFIDDLSSTLLRGIQHIVNKMDQNTFNGFKTNCIKKKKKVLSLMELYNKDSVTCTAHMQIYKDELQRVDKATEDFVDYIDDLLTQLELSSEQERISDIDSMRKQLINDVKHHKQEIMEKVQTISGDVASVETQGHIASNLTGNSTVTPQTSGGTGTASLNLNVIPKLTLKYNNILEDISDFQKILEEVKSVNDLSDSEITFFMRKLDYWDQKIKEIKTEVRKFQEESIGKEEVKLMVDDVTTKCNELKELKNNKASALTDEDNERGLKSLCENKNKSSVVFPEPFKGIMGENIFKFKREIMSAIKDTQVKKADQVRTLVKYLRGDAKARVGDHQPDLDSAIKVLEDFYGNPNLIWLKYKQEFEREFSGNINKKWGELGSTKRVDAIARLMEFIRQSIQFAEDYPQLKEDILSAHTVKLLMKSMPQEEVRMVYLSVEEITATHQEKIEKIQEILGKLKNCGILAVNELVDDNFNEASKGQSGATRNSNNTRNPLGINTHSSLLCSVDVKHDCTKSRKCQPSWGLLGCEELYKLGSVEERILYCKESSCCCTCGIALTSGGREETCKRCDYSAPTNRKLVRCNVSWFSAAANRVQRCFRGAALCLQHQNSKNADPKLLEWLKEKRIKHEMFVLNPGIYKLNKRDKKDRGSTDINLPSDRQVLDMLNEEMEKCDAEDGLIENIPEGENMFQFFLLQGKPNTEPIQVFADSGANFWFSLESVMQKLISVRTHKGAMPIAIGGGNVTYSTGEWAAALPLADGGYQAVRGQTLRSLVGQMPRFNLTRTLKEIKEQYPDNSRLQSLVIPPVLGGEIEMILGSKYLKIYPEVVQVTPTGLTVSVSKLRSPLGRNTAVISGPVRFINTIFQSKHARDAFESMKAMIVHLRDYKPTLEFFPQSHAHELFDKDIPDIDKESFRSESKTNSSVKIGLPIICNTCQIHITAQSELKRFMDLQEAGLKTEYKCAKCRSCEECKRGVGFERISLRQEAEQILVKDSIELMDGYAVAKLPFMLSPEENLKNNRTIALKRLDNVIKRYCKDPEMKKGLFNAWDKMITKGHLVFLKDLGSKDREQIQNSEVSYWIPWNVNFKESLSTPIRTTFDASSQTCTGLSLNDCLAKGTPNLVQLLKLVLDWMIGPFAFCGDISQFYPSILLKSEHWRYQRILLRENLDLKGDVVEGILVKLAFGVQSVSAQSEEAVKRVAKNFCNPDSDVAKLLTQGRYVDDVGKSMMLRSDAVKVIKDTTEILKTKLNMEIKGWSLSGEKPDSDVSLDGVSVGFGGLLWYPEADTYSLNIPSLCFERKQRGKLPDGAFGFDPKAMSMEDYVPENLSRRQITRAVARVWDPTGKLAPITLRIKHDIRKLIKESPEWDCQISSAARSLWVQNFKMIEDVRYYLYNRCSRPNDALRKTCRLMILVDAAEWGMMATIYVGWERQSGSYSCSHLLGKGLLGPEPLTLPQKELHILSVGADMKELCYSALEDWVEEVIICSDSEIALCWSGYETVKLNQYNRVRVLNITSKLSLEDLFHVKGSYNPADIGTRVKCVSAADVSPDAEYIQGKKWMQLSKTEAISQGYIKSIGDIKLRHDQKKVVKKGIVFDSFEKDDPNIFGILMPARVDVDKVALREVAGNYPFSPLLRNFLSFVDITAIIVKVRNKIISKRSTETSSSDVSPSRFSIASFYSSKVISPPPDHIVNEIDRNNALEFIFQRETEIVKKFNSTQLLSKIAIEEDKILFCKTRVLEGHTVQAVGGLHLEAGMSELLNLNFKVPLIDEHSPLAYPLALHLHDRFNHKGYETCYRMSLNYVKILGGLRIFKNINSNCAICMKERKKYLEVSMGKIAECQLTVSPLFYFTQCDMWGPLKCYCPGYERSTRNNKSYEVYMLVFACVATGAINLQVIEGKSTQFVLDGCSRFFHEASVPKILFPDDDGALTLAFSRGEIDVRDLASNLYKVKGILFEKCAPQAHSSHGKVERAIRTLQQSFTRSGAPKCKLTATGWMTIAKSIEREFNDTPIGFLIDKSNVGGNPLLRVLKPSTLKGMNTSDRAPSGLFKVPDLPQKHFSKIQECYDLWVKCWSISYLPLILKSQKWHQDNDCLSVNDIVYFKLKESPLKAEWRLGKVDNVKLGRDGKIREANIAYKILKENSDTWTHNVVTRPARELVKLYEIGDTTFSEDMAAVCKAARSILMDRGALEDQRQADDAVVQPVQQSLVAHSPFLNCQSSMSWLERDSDAGFEIKEENDKPNDTIDTHYDYDLHDEILFLV